MGTKSQMNQLQANLLGLTGSIVEIDREEQMLDVQSQLIEDQKKLDKMLIDYQNNPGAYGNYDEFTKAFKTTQREMLQQGTANLRNWGAGVYQQNSQAIMANYEVKANGIAAGYRRQENIKNMQNIISERNKTVGTTLESLHQVMNQNKENIAASTWLLPSQKEEMIAAAESEAKNSFYMGNIQSQFSDPMGDYHAQEAAAITFLNENKDALSAGEYSGYLNDIRALKMQARTEQNIRYQEEDDNREREYHELYQSGNAFTLWSRLDKEQFHDPDRNKYWYGLREQALRDAALGGSGQKELSPAQTYELYEIWADTGYSEENKAKRTDELIRDGLIPGHLSRDAFTYGRSIGQSFPNPIFNNAKKLLDGFYSNKSKGLEGDDLIAMENEHLERMNSLNAKILDGTLTPEDVYQMSVNLTREQITEEQKTGRGYQIERTRELDDIDYTNVLKVKGFSAMHNDVINGNLVGVAQEYFTEDTLQYQEVYSRAIESAELENLKKLDQPFYGAMPGYTATVNGKERAVRMEADGSFSYFFPDEASTEGGIWEPVPGTAAAEEVVREEKTNERNEAIGEFIEGRREYQEVKDSQETDRAETVEEESFTGIETRYEDLSPNEQTLFDYLESDGFNLDIDWRSEDWYPTEEQTKLIADNIGRSAWRSVRRQILRMRNYEVMR